MSKLNRTANDQRKIGTPQSQNPFAVPDVDWVREQQAAWDDFASDYYQAERESQLPYVSEVIAFLKQQALLPAKLMDLGCGAGRFSIPFAQAKVQVQAVDFSEAMLRLLKSRVQALNLDQWIEMEQAAWQTLVAQQRPVPVLWLSMLPEIDAAEIQQLGQLVTHQLMIFRLTAVTNDQLDRLKSQLNLPQERPEVQPQLMTTYQSALRPDLHLIQHHYFHYDLSETMTRLELDEYLRDVLELDPVTMTKALEMLDSQIIKHQLTMVDHYTFELMIFQR